MKQIFITIIFYLSFFTVNAQSVHSIYGKVQDSSSNIVLKNSTVTVITKKDSILSGFAWVDQQGRFVINKLKPGEFILKVIYQNYVDYSEPFNVTELTKEINFGEINLQLKSHILQEIIIKGQATAIKLNGDTTEFNAKVFVIQPNDKVEDLLKLLPGLEVDKDGKIKANGQVVTKVLVDGEEFFGDDPKLVTQNLRADMVDKVQLFDKKSDQATFSGIDDGKKSRTINIKLKEDRKNGQFGKASAGVGTNNYYESQVLYNRFIGAQKYSAYGTISNNGKLGLGSADNSRLNNDPSDSETSGETIRSASTSTDQFETYNGIYDGKGQPVSRTGGAHYDNKWDNGRQSINTNYKIGSIQVEGLTLTDTRQSLDGQSIERNSNQSFKNKTFRQKLDFIYSTKLDSLSSLKITMDGTLRNFEIGNTYQTMTDGPEGYPISNQTRDVRNSGNQRNINTSLFFTHKFKKNRRTISWLLKGSYNKDDGDGFLKSKTNYLGPLGLDSAEIVDQYKRTLALKSEFSSSITYTEPLSKVLAVAINYSINASNNNQTRETFTPTGLGQYSLLDTAFSNRYRFNQLLNHLGATFSYKYNKGFINAGSSASFNRFRQVDDYYGTTNYRSFFNWNPQLTVQFNPSQQAALTFNYSGNTVQPTIDQIQPVPVNNDPQLITVGNPTLRPSFQNSLYLNYNSFRSLAGISFFLDGGLNFTSQPIINNLTTDLITGKTTIRYNNLSDKSAVNFYLIANYMRRFKTIKSTIGLSLNTNGNIYYGYINSILNQTKVYTYAMSLQFTKTTAKKYLLSLNTGPQYVVNKLSLISGNNNSKGFHVNGRATYYLPLKLFLSSDISYVYNGATKDFEAQYKTVWNASAGKTFLPNDQLKVFVSGNDLLKQNINFTRRSNGNTITQVSTSGIQRYFMLTVSWDFTKFNKVLTKD